MRIKKCPYCKDIFEPKKRLGKRQISCGKDSCKNKHALKCKREWKRKNKKVSRMNDMDFRDNNRDYSKKYRASHPDYVERNRKQTKYRKRLKKRGLQSRIDILQLIVNKSEMGIFLRFAKVNRSLIKLFIDTLAKQSRNNILRF